VWCEESNGVAYCSRECREQNKKGPTVEIAMEGGSKGGRWKKKDASELQVTPHGPGALRQPIAPGVSAGRLPSFVRGRQSVGRGDASGECSVRAS
jgi:hypothetical protein